MQEHEDVFGNFTARFDMEAPYQELVVAAESEVEVFDYDPFEFIKELKVRPAFPLVWMPWEIKMLQPYLTSQELPDTQLAELYEYAQSFVQRNKGDILESLFDINLTLFREYKYTPGSTTLATTPFDVYGNRFGVCQDFANLFITLARLLPPPRPLRPRLHLYVATPGEARAQSDASHAWVQVYIPSGRWKGLDPTNGVLPHLDHIRTGVGRNVTGGYVAPVTGNPSTPPPRKPRSRVDVVKDISPPGNPWSCRQRQRPCIPNGRSPAGDATLPTTNQF